MTDPTFQGGFSVGETPPRTGPTNMPPAFESGVGSKEHLQPFNEYPPVEGGNEELASGEYQDNQGLKDPYRIVMHAAHKKNILTKGRERSPQHVSYPVKIQNLNQQVDPLRARRKHRGKKRGGKKHNKFARRASFGEYPHVETKILDGFLLLHSCRVKYPYEAIKSKLVCENIVEVEEGDLLFFQNLVSLDISENNIRMEQLVNLKALHELSMQYNQIEHFHFPSGAFPKVEVLNLAFNNINPGELPSLAALPSLRFLDISGNELSTLAEDMSMLVNVEDLNISSNNFTSDSVVTDPNIIFKSLSSLPNMRKLNLSRNSLKAFHFEALSEGGTPPPFPQIREIDFSFNKVEDEGNLLYCQKMTNLQLLNITGNPFAMKGGYRELEHILYSTVSAIVVNLPTSPPAYLKRSMFPKKERLPYPKPAAMILQDAGKHSVKRHMYDAELNKGIALPLGDIKPNKDTDEDIFPKAIGYGHSDIFTPPEKIQKRFKQHSKPYKPDANDQGGKMFFITENEPGGGQMEEEAEELLAIEAEKKQEILNIENKEDRPTSDEKEDEEEPDTDDITNFGKRKIGDFLNLCREFLGDEKEYQSAMAINVACKSLKHSLRFPSTFVTKDINANYMRPTVASNIMKTNKYEKSPSLQNSVTAISTSMKGKVGESTSRTKRGPDKKNMFSTERIEKTIEQLLESDISESDEKSYSSLRSDEANLPIDVDF